MSVARIRGEGGEGRLHLNQVRLALRLMMEHHPNLRCGVHRRRDGAYYLHEFDHAAAMASVVLVPRRGDDHRWKAEAERLLEYRSPQFTHPDSLLFEVSFVSDINNSRESGGEEDRCEIILMSSHVIIDGTSNFAFHSELLRFCKLLKQAGCDNADENSDTFLTLCHAEHRNISLSSNFMDAVRRDPRLAATRRSILWKFLPPIAGIATDVLASLLHFHSSVGRLAKGEQNKNTAPECGLGECREVLETRTADERLLASVVAEAKATGVTVHAIMHAIYVDAHAEVFNLPPQFPLNVTTPIRLASLISPPIPRTELLHGVFHGQHNVHVLARGGAEDCHSEQWRSRLRQYATDCHDHLHRNPATKLPESAFADVHLAPCWDTAFRKPLFLRLLLADRKDAGRVGNVVISNVGDLSPHLATSWADDGQNDRDGRKLFAIESVHVFQSNRCVGFECFFLFATMSGKIHLAWTIPSLLLPRDTGKKLADAFMNRLERLATTTK